MKKRERWHLVRKMFRKNLKGEKKKVEKTRHWSGFTLKSKFTQHNFHYTCNLPLHTAPWRTQSSFSFFWMVGKKAFAPRQGHWPPFRCIAVCGTSTVSEHSKLRELVFPSQTAMHWICGTTTSSCTTLRAPQVYWTTRFLRLRSCLVRSFQFGVSSCPFLHPCSSNQSHTSSSLPNPHLIFFQWIYFHSKGASTSPQWFGKFFPSVSMDWFFAQALSDISLGFVWAVTHVLFVDDESRGDSNCQFACFLFQVIDLLSTNFCFSGTIFLWSSTQTIKSSRFSFTATSCQIFSATFCHVLKSDGKHKESNNEEREREKQLEEMMIGIHLWMSRGLSVSHTSHSTTRNTLFLPKLAWNYQPRHSPWLIVMLENAPARDLLFRPWWPFTPTAFTHFSWWWRVWSSAIRSPWQNMRREKKRTGNMRIKARRWKEEEVVFAQWFFLKNKWRKEIRKKKNIW